MVERHIGDVASPFTAVGLFAAFLGTALNQESLAVFGLLLSGGMFCVSVSREIRLWLDRRTAQKTPPHHAPGQANGKPHP